MRERILKLQEELPNLKLTKDEIDQLTKDAEAFDSLLRAMNRLDLTGITPQVVVKRQWPR